MPQGCVQPQDPYWLKAPCVSHLCSHRKECRECGSHDADRRQSSPGGPHHTCGAACRIAGANQRRPECRMASRTRQWHSTSAILDAPVPRMQSGCRGAHFPSAPCLHDAACTHRSQRQGPGCRRAVSSHMIGSILDASPLRVTSMLAPQGMPGMRLA